MIFGKLLLTPHPIYGASNIQWQYCISGKSQKFRRTIFAIGVTKEEEEHKNSVCGDNVNQ